jgi:hypothetical protein
MFGIYPFADAPFASLASTNKLIALTGVGASGNVGTVTNGGYSFALSGVGATGAVGTVSLGARTVALTGVFASGLLGTIQSSPSFALSGVGASGNVGGEQGGQLISGVSASGAVGTVVAIYWNTIDDGQNAGWVIINTA